MARARRNQPCQTDSWARRGRLHRYVFRRQKHSGSKLVTVTMFQCLASLAGSACLSLTRARFCGVLGVPVLAPAAAGNFGDSSTAVYALLGRRGRRISWCGVWIVAIARIYVGAHFPPAACPPGSPGAVSRAMAGEPAIPARKRSPSAPKWAVPDGLTTAGMTCWGSASQRCRHCWIRW